MRVQLTLATRKYETLLVRRSYTLAHILTRSRGEDIHYKLTIITLSQKVEWLILFFDSFSLAGPVALTVDDVRLQLVLGQNVFLTASDKANAEK